MIALWLLTCAAPTTDCAAQTPGPAADACWREALLATGPEGVEQVLSLAPRFADPLAREEAVMAWIRAHGPRAAPAQAERLCALLPADERPACARRVHSAHLRR